MPAIYDQGDLGSCTANAVGAVVQYERILLKHKPDFIPSRLFIYYNERVLEGTIDWDSGASIRDSIRAVAQWGECPENEWIYDIAQFATRPTDQCFTDALKYKALKYEHVLQSLTQLKTALSLGKPVTFGFTVYQSFESSTVTRTGIVPLPKRTESVLGGHAVVLVGYDEDIQRFIVRNSWGTNWGMAGYFTMPYSYVTNVNLASDFWAITATLA
jgi:C1A family cysteine protease